ncbi:hypothetical protein [Providencia rettgeri]|uniref:hypothetical protein n=1 Tax=Providencia rettgeri TaxID=587 RepID=UPI002572FD5C|nr:hypothetical protein [Providencia rettgeri]MDL9985337.1 hypothetical protein [Providencia rettgeri]
MAERTKIIPLIRLITLAAGLVIVGGVSASVIEVNTQTLPVIGHAPVVTDVQFNNKTPAVNDTVTADPKITDADKDALETSLFQWKLDGKNISGATQNSYKLVPGDGNGKQLSVEVTPQTDPKITEPATGAIFTSSTLTTRGLAPEAHDVKIDGQPEPGRLLTGNYRYHDGDSPSDPESGTSFEWFCFRNKNHQAISTSRTYHIQDADIGCEIYFNVIPRSSSGTPSTGAQVQSNKVTVAKAIPSHLVEIYNGNQIGNRSGYGYNMVINYSHLGYGKPISITIREYRNGNINATEKYQVGKKTHIGSIVTDDGNTIKFGDNARSSIGETIYLVVRVDFPNGKLAHATSSKIVLQRR